MKPTLSQCIEIVERVVEGPRLTDLEKYAATEVLQAAAWWHEERLGKVSKRLLRRRSRRFSTRKFDRLFKETP